MKNGWVSDLQDYRAVQTAVVHGGGRGEMRDSVRALACLREVGHDPAQRLEPRAALCPPAGPRRTSLAQTPLSLQFV